MSKGLSVHFVTPLATVADPGDGNVDVEVSVDGSRYAATFFTLRNLETLLDRYATTGECAHGTYVWASHMIVVRRLTEDAIRQAIEGLIQDGELTGAMEGPL